MKFDKFQRKIFPQFKIKELKEFPIPVTSKENKSKVVQLSKEIASLYAKNSDCEVEKKEAKLEDLINGLFFDETIKIKAA